MMHLPLVAALPTWVGVWLTPIWLVAVGALLGLVVVFILAHLFAPAVGESGNTLLTEGPLLPIFLVTAVMAGFALVGALVVDDRVEILSSLWRVPSTGTTEHQFQIPPAAADADPDSLAPVEIDVAFTRKELRELTVASNVRVTMSAADQRDDEEHRSWQVEGEQPFVWRAAEQSPANFPDEAIERLYVWNLGSQPATLDVTVSTTPQFPQVSTIWITAVGVIGLFLLYFLQGALAPKIAAISLATAKSEMVQPLFIISICLGLFLLTLFLWIPYNTFGEDIKMLKDSSLTLIKVLAIIVALWAASTSIADEIDGRTALTVLSKPISRRHFILGKFTGIVWVVTVMFVVLGVYYLFTVSYKPIYDARETSLEAPTWMMCHAEMISSIPGLVLVYFEAIVMTAIGVAISTRLPVLANFVLCATIYAVGHLTPLIVKTSVGEFVIVRFVAQLLATIFPVLEHFDMEPAIAVGREVPLDYLGMAFIYCLLYSAIAMLVALTMFEDRDLA